MDKNLNKSKTLNMRHKLKARFFYLTAIALVFAFTSCSKSANWTQFRGPDANMALASTGLPEKWSSDTNVVWTAALDGAGYSSPVVWGNRIFITSTFPEKVNPAPERPPMPAGPPQQQGQAPQPVQAPPQGQQPRQGQAGPQPVTTTSAGST